MARSKRTSAADTDRRYMELALWVARRMPAAMMALAQGGVRP